MTPIRTAIATTVVLLSGLLTAELAQAQAGAQPQRAGAPTDRQRFVGTYRLVVTEVKDPSGKWIRNPTFNSVGYITYDESGYMGVHIMPRNRTKFAAAVPTPAEAQAAVRGYTAYYGPFKVNEQEKSVFHEKGIGQLNPGGTPVFKRFYEFVGNQLILIPGDNGITKDQATSRLIWERMPDAPLSAEAKAFVGTYRLLYTDRYTLQNGKETAHGEKTEARAGSVIIYTRSGHMMVHLRDTQGRQKYAGTTPTPDEALAAFRSYVGYFGTFKVHETAKPVYVVHHLEGALNPGMGPELQRFYQFTGNVLRLGGPPTTADGKTTGGHLYWERIPPAR